MGLELIALRFPSCWFEEQIFQVFYLQMVIGWWNPSVLEMSTYICEWFYGLKLSLLLWWDCLCTCNMWYMHYMNGCDGVIFNRWGVKEEFELFSMDEVLRRTCDRWFICSRNASMFSPVIAGISTWLLYGMELFLRCLQIPMIGS